MGLPENLGKRLKPGVPRPWLLAIAGVMWAAVGVMLWHLAWRWLKGLSVPVAAGIAAAGLVAGVVVYKFGFSKIVGKNIRRISDKPEKPCVFAFQAWKSYLLIAVMIALGVTMRHSAMPRGDLAFIYSTIGTALMFGSTGYALALKKILFPR
jgi:hypothetical protein